MAINLNLSKQMSSNAASAANTALTKSTIAMNQLSDEQYNLLQKLYSYASTGNYNDLFTAGQSYSDALGYYQLGEGEQEAYNALQDLIAGGKPEMMQLAAEEYKNILNNDYYDPYSETGTFSGYKTNVMNELQESSDVLKRNLAVQGDLYSTRLIQEQGDLNQAAQDSLTNKLAELYDTYTSRRLTAAQSAASLGVAEESIDQNRLAMLSEIGAIQRQLEEQKLKDQYAEWQRSRTEVQDILTKAQDILNIKYDSGSTGSSSSSSYGNNYDQEFNEAWNRNLNVGAKAYANSIFTTSGNSLNSNETYASRAETRSNARQYWISQKDNPLQKKKAYEAYKSGDTDTYNWIMKSLN